MPSFFDNVSNNFSFFPPVFLLFISSFAISSIISSPSPITIMSKKGAIGSGLKQDGPPAIMIG